MLMDECTGLLRRGWVFGQLEVGNWSNYAWLHDEVVAGPFDDLYAAIEAGAVLEVVFGLAPVEQLSLIQVNDSGE